MPGSDASAPLAVDHSLGGRYRLIGPIARGGMAEVWEGYDEILSRPVAVKVLLSHLATDQLVRERFRREAITAARLAHPNVVATYDTGLDAGVAYIVMELVRGDTLRHLLAERGALPVPVAVAVADQIADALAHAHRANLVHRDIKPANVLITDDDGPLPRIKVTDFGIAKAAESVGVDLTSTGMVLGTPKYLSPEQVDGREPDSRADLYALGVVLYEMLAGEPPFSARTGMATALAHLREEAPLVSTRRAGIPPALDRIVAVLLAKDPAARYTSAVELRRVLSSVGRAGATAPNPTPTVFPTPAYPPTRAFHPDPLRLSQGPAAVDDTGRQRGPLPPTGQASAVGGLPPKEVPVAVWAVPSVDPRAPVPTTRMGDTSALSGAMGAPPPHGPGPGHAYPSYPYHDRQGAPTARNPVASRRPGRSDGLGVGSVSSSSNPTRRNRRRHGPGIVVAVLVVAGGIIAAVLLTRTLAASGSAVSSGAPSSGPLPLVSAKVFVLAGHPADNAAEAVNVIDNNPGTVWTTDFYANSHFGNLYPGIGIAVKLSGVHTLHTMVVTAPVGGWTAESYVASRFPAGASSVGAWGAPTDAKGATGTSTTFSLGGRRGTWVLLWLTSTGGPPYRAQIGHISVS